LYITFGVYIFKLLFIANKALFELPTKPYIGYFQLADAVIQTMKDSILQDSIRIENELLSAIEGGNIQEISTLLDALQGTLTAFQHDIHAGEIRDDATLSLSKAMASRISSISELFLEPVKQSTTFISGLASELDRLETQSFIAPLSPKPFVHTTPDEPPYQPYIPSAYSWLLKNLHNPFPSNEVKKSISQSTNTPPKLICAWFTNVRRKIGWSALSRRHFSGSRAETVDAAYRTFVMDDPKRPVESNIIFEFMELKVAAESLYSDKFKKSVLARTLNKVIDMVDEEKRQEKDLQEMSELPYPSPDRSNASSPEPYFSPIPANKSHAIRIVDRKRRASPSTNSSDTEDDVLDTPSDRPTKRLRCDPFFTSSPFCFNSSTLTESPKPHLIPTLTTPSPFLLHLDLYA
jgi:Homeobox KN domain/C-terminal domain of homeodomain 1